MASNVSPTYGKQGCRRAEKSLFRGVWQQIQENTVPRVTELSEATLAAKIRPEIGAHLGNVGLTIVRSFIGFLILLGVTSLTGCILHFQGIRGEAIVQAGGPPVLRRLTQEQYRQSIAHIFGSSVLVGGRFEPDSRQDGLTAIGAGAASIPASGLEEYSKMARAIASQVLSKPHRPFLIGCTPKSEMEPDNVCARQALSRIGRLLFRRPLTRGELDGQIAAAASATKALGSFHAGIEFSLVSMLEAPQFLFIWERAVPDPAHPEHLRMEAFSKASRISFLLWNTTPDDELLDAAEHRKLETIEGITLQVDRLISSPRFEAGLRSFFADMLQFDKLDSLAKDRAIYPKFNFEIAAHAREETLRTISELVIAKNGDYRDLFTTRETFVTPLLGSIYKVPIVRSNGSSSTWVHYEFPENSGRSGILTHVSFVALHSYPGRTSPTLRGKALREILLCQKVPNPPANVNSNFNQDPSNPLYQTVRKRLSAHATESMCTGCHKFVDPIGLAFENFDSIGAYRSQEDGAPINTSGELDATKFKDVIGLGRVVHDHPATPLCLVNRLYSYGIGRLPTDSEATWINSKLARQFAQDGYRVGMLFRRIATSETFFGMETP